ncbi:hypothetical protein [Wolbachia endosymbiont of Litomosoides sigmodontis]|nr:hypothetical protein [Wolbachia endosymbiont of Litomosoides sigmodontis]
MKSKLLDKKSREISKRNAEENANSTYVVKKTKYCNCNKKA